MRPTPDADLRSWCEERLRQPQEDLNLARLFSPPRLRPAVAATAAIYIELETLAGGRRDLNVARMKLGWWREELARLGAGRPAHPATRLLASSSAPAAVTQLFDLVTGMELNLLEGPPNEFAGAWLRAERGCAPLMSALDEQTGARYPDQAGRDYRRLSAGIGLARQLSLPLTAALRADIITGARAELMAARPLLDSATPPLRVLATLAWYRLARSEPPAVSRRTDRRRVILAWRAARGHLPRDFG